VTSATESRKVKVQQWGSVLTVVLVEGSDLLPKDDNGFSDPYVKFQLGKERYKSKVSCLLAVLPQLYDAVFGISGRGRFLVAAKQGWKNLGF